MITWAIQQIILSLLIIVLAHYIYSFFKDNLTTPKIRDMVNTPIRQYNNIYTNDNKTAAPPNKTNEDTKNMKNELQNYLNELKNKNNIVPESEITNNNMFSQFPNNY